MSLCWAEHVPVLAEHVHVLVEEALSSLRLHSELPSLPHQQSRIKRQVWLFITSVRLEMPKMCSYVKAGISADELNKADLGLFLPGY